MAQAKFRIGITRDNLKPNGKPIFDESAFKILDDPGTEYKFLPETEPEPPRETAAKYDARAVMRARIPRKPAPGANRGLKLTARSGVGYDRGDGPACTESGVILSI